MSLDWRKRLSVTENYGVVLIERKDSKGAVTRNSTFNPALFDALGAIKKNGRQKRIVKRMMGAA